MKTKLLRKIRKRYSITEYKVEPWMENSPVWPQYKIWVERSLETNLCFVFKDHSCPENWDTRIRFFKDYNGAIEHLKKIISEDYCTSKYAPRRFVKIQSRKVWWR